MNEARSPYVLTNQNSPAFWLIDNLWMPLAGSFLTDGNFCFIEQVCGVGIGGPCTHAHPSDEGLYILEGHCTFHAGGETVQAGPGTFVSVPRLVEHSFTVDEPNSRLLNFYTPGGFEMLLMSIATPAAERKPPEPNSRAHAATLDGGRVLPGIRSDRCTRASVRRPAHEGQHGDQAV